MGILSSLKKLFFVNKSIVESAADKTGDYLKEKSTEIKEKGNEVLKESGEAFVNSTKDIKENLAKSSESLIEKSKELAGDTFEKIKDIGEDISEKAKDTLEKVSENEYVQKAADVSEKLGEQILDKGEDLVEKAKDISEKVGGEILDKAGSLSEKIGEKAIEIKDDLSDKAKVAADKIGEKFDETVQKAEEWQRQEDAKPKKEFADDDLSVSDESLLEGKDDFFSKASEFADGDYNAFESGPKIIDNNDLVEPLKKEGKAAGFVDMDGDGNEIIDDAITEEE